MPNKGTSRGQQDTTASQTHVPHQAPGTRRTRASAAAAAKSKEVDEPTETSPEAAPPQAVVNKSSKTARKGLSSTLVDTQVKTTLIPAKTTVQTKPKGGKGGPASEGKAPQPGKPNGRKRAGTETASKAPTAKKRDAGTGKKKPGLAPSRPILGEDEEDDDVRSISGKEDDAEPEMDDEEALSGDDDLTGLQPAEVVKRLAQEQVIWPGDVPDAEDRRQPVPSKIDKAGTIVVQEFEDEPPQMTGQGGIRLQRAIAEIPVWPSVQPETTQVTGPEDVKPIIAEPAPESFDPRTDLVPERGACNMTRQQHDIRDLLKRSVGHYNSSIIFEDAFPTSTGRARTAKDAITCILKDFQPEDFATAMQRRIRTDHIYLNRLAAMITGRDSNLKAKFKDMAYAKVCKGYALTNGCQTKIATLLDQQQYIYTNAESGNPRTTEPYRHPAVISLLAYWFNMKNSALHEHQDRLKSNKDGSLLIPVPLLALVGTMINFVLLDWKNAGGNDPPSKSAFAGKVVEDTYRTHLGLLRSLQNKHEGKYERMLALVFKAAEAFKESENAQTYSVPRDDSDEDAATGIMDVDGMEE